jgi:predicted Zn-dependent peptidase
VKDFFFSYYAPNNAILSVSGNISFERVVELSEKWFGRIPAREIRKADIPQEPEQTEERRMTVYRPVPFEFLNLSFHIPSVRNADFVKSDMISDVLSLGKSSRVYRELVDGCKMFSAVDVSVLPRLDTGLLTFYCSLNPGVDLNEAEAALWQTIERLKADGPADDEMTMVKNNYVTEREYDIISVGDRARLMAYYEMLGDAEQVNSLCDNYCSVDGNALREECNRIMTREKANTLFYLKEK